MNFLEKNNKEVFKTPDDYFSQLRARIEAETIGEKLDLSAQKEIILQKTTRSKGRVLPLLKWASVAAAAAIAGWGIWLYSQKTEIVQSVDFASAVQQLDLDESELLAEVSDEVFIDYLNTAIDTIHQEMIVNIVHEELEIESNTKEEKVSSQITDTFEALTDEELMDAIIASGALEDF
jgi:hypothetical protein